MQRIRYMDTTAFFLGKKSGGGGDREPVLLYYSHDGSELLYTEVLTPGADGAYTGTPERPDTAQYDYTFTGWSRTPDGEADPDARKGVTKNRKVYAAYTAVVRTYTVRLYNGETLLQTATNVPYGGSVTYTGDTPVKTGVSDPTPYEFVGWSLTPNGPADPDALTDIPGDRDVYAAYEVEELYITDAEAMYQDSSGAPQFDTLAVAVANAPSGTTVYLLENIALSETLTVTQAALTIDCLSKVKNATARHTLGSANGTAGLTVSDGATLTFQNVLVTAPVTVNNGGSIEEFNSELNTTVRFNGPVEFDENGVSTQFVTDQRDETTGQIATYEANIVFANTSKAATINGGIFTGTLDTRGPTTITDGDFANFAFNLPLVSQTITISGGVFHSELTLPAIVTISGKETVFEKTVTFTRNVTINDGDFAEVIFEEGTRSVSINGGTFHSEITTPAIRIPITDGVFEKDVHILGQATISGGVYNSTVEIEGVTNISSGTFRNVLTVKGALTITNGSFLTGFGIAGVDAGTSTDLPTSIAISGGTYANAIDSTLYAPYLESGYQIVLGAYFWVVTSNS